MRSKYVKDNFSFDEYGICEEEVKNVKLIIMNN